MGSLSNLLGDFQNLTLEFRLLYSTMGLTMLGTLLMFVAVSTDHWVQLHIPGGYYRNATDSYVLGQHSGLWRICRETLKNNTLPVVHRDYCVFLKFFVSDEAVEKNIEIDDTILDYSRSETAFAIISIALMLLGFVFSFYALREPRYMFKRLAALMHCMTAVCILVCAEVMINSVDYESDHLQSRHPEGSHYHFGWSFWLCWVVFAIYVLATLVFLFYGRKRKGDRALTEDEAKENEPVNIGRI